MKLLFNIRVQEDRVGEFNRSHYIIGDRAYLQNFIGLSTFWLLDEFGNLIKKFDDLLLDTVINLTSNYSSLKKGEITEGGLFVMEAEWERHFTFVQVGNNYQICIKGHRDLFIPADDFYNFILDFTNYAFCCMEYFYPDIQENPNFRDWKSEVYGNLEVATQI